MNNYLSGTQTDLISCWQLNEGDGDIAYDMTDNQNDGIITSAAWCEGIQLGMASAEEEIADLPVNIKLENYPNPFNGETRIDFSLPSTGPVRLELFSIRGERIVTLIDSRLASGPHTAVWTGQDEGGRPVPSGLYFYRLTAGRQQTVRRLLLIQ